MGDAFGQAEREVWDVLNVGPLQRFTANGRLVHNCALILDHSGTVGRLGFPTDEFPLELDDGKPKKSSNAEQEKPEPKPCPCCAFVKPPRTPVCPKCGHASQRQNEIETQDGELEFVSRKKKAKIEDKQRVWSELLALRMAKGYSEGWASHKYRSYFGVWPRGLKDVCIEPSAEIRSWVTAQNIRYAKSKEARHAA